MNATTLKLSLALVLTTATFAALPTVDAAPNCTDPYLLYVELLGTSAGVNRESDCVGGAAVVGAFGVSPGAGYRVNPQDGSSCLSFKLNPVLGWTTLCP